MAQKIDNYTNTQSTSHATATLTMSHTCGSGYNRKLIVCVASDNTRAVSGVTYAGVAMTQVGQLNDGSSGNRISMWYLDAPASGANDVVVTWTSAPSVDVVVGAVSFDGIKQTMDAGATASGTTTTVTVNVTKPVASEWCIDFYVTNSNIVSTVGANQTKLWGVAPNAGFEVGFSYERPTTGSSHTMSWTNANASAWATIGVILRPATMPTIRVNKLRPRVFTPGRAK